MSSVDDRIVNMQFNNKQFEAGATQSQKTLEGLERSIANAGSSKGLTTMASSVDTVSSRFTAMQVAGAAALGTIVSKATTAGLSMIKSLTISPIADGFREYETNLNSVQTIMANTGEKTKVVGKYLNELNHYSDQTIYNFSQMADSIGKFTAAGVSLPNATDAIKGMANTAALSGANTMQLNSAMYQMSQALASGTIKLMDWNSLVTANMGGKNIQQALMDTARTVGEQGKAMDSAIEKNGTFRESLTEGWLTADVFTKTMRVMAGETKKNGDTVAFTVKQLKGMGYAEEAAKKLHTLSAASIESATKIKTFTQLLDVVKESVGSGFGQVFQNLFGNLKEAGALWTGVGDKVTGAISNIFAGVNGVLLGWKQLGGYTALWNAFGNIFQTIGNLLHPFVAAFQAILPASGQAGKGLADASKGFESATEWMEKASRGAEILTPVLVAAAKGIKGAFGLIGDGIGLISDAVGQLDVIKDKMASFSVGGFNLGDMFGNAADLADAAKNILSGIAQGLSQASASEIVAAVGEVATSIIDAFKSALGIHSPAREMVPIGVDIIRGIIEGLISSMSLILQAVMSIGPLIVSGIAVIGSFIMGAFEQLFGDMDAIDFATALNAIFTGALLLTANNFLKSSGGFLKSIQGFFSTVGTSLKTFTEALGTQAKAELIKSYAIAIGVMAAALVVLSFLDPKALGKSLAAMGIMLSLLVGSLYALGKVNSEMNMGLIAASLLLISMAMINLALAVTILGKQDLQTLGKGLGAMAIGLGVLVAALFAMSKISGSIEGMAGSIFVIALAMNALAAAVLAFGSMSLKTLSKGLGAMAIGLGLLVGAMLGMDKMKGSPEGLAASILIMAVALNLMAISVAAFGNMDMGTLAKGFAAMAIGLGIMVGALLILSGNSAGVLAASAGMVLMATAMNMLVGVILVLGAAPWEVVAKGLGFVALALGVFLLAGLAAMYVAPGLLALGVSIGLIGAGLFLAGAGMLAFGTGFALMAAAGVAGVAILVAAFEAFLALLPTFAIQIAAAFVVFIETIAKASPRIRDAMGEIIENMLGVIEDAIPKVGKLVSTLIETVFDVITKAIPLYGKLISTLLETGLNVIKGFVPKLVSAGVSVIMSILDGVTKAIPKIGAKAVELILAFLDTVAEQGPKLADGAAKAIVKFINGLSTAIDNNAGPIRTAGLKLALAIADGVSGGLLGRGMDIVRSAAESLANALPGWMKKVLGINSPAKETIPIGEFAGEGIAVGMEKSMRTVQTSAEALGRAAADHIAKGMQGSIQRAIVATTALVNAVLTTGESDIAALRQKELEKIGSADFEELVASYKRKHADAVAGKADKANNVSDKAQKEADKAKAAADKTEDKAEKLKKDHEKQYKQMMELAKQQQKHADKLKDAAKEQRLAAKEQQKAANQASKAADKAEKVANAQRKAAEAATAKRESEEAWRDMSAFERFQSAQKDVSTTQGSVNQARYNIDRTRSQIDALRVGGVTKKERAEIIKLKGVISSTQDALKGLNGALDAAKSRALSLFNAFIQEERGLLKSRIESVQEARQAYLADRAAEEAYDAADTQGKIDIMEARAKASEAKSAELNEQADAALAAADKLMDAAAAAGPANGAAAQALIADANAKVDEADALAQAAMDAADKAKEQKDQAKDLLDQAKDASTTDGTTGSGSTIQPSRTALEDAAKTIDRYTASLLQAQDDALAGPRTVQFVQNNTSPAALTTSEIYRQSKNLLSATELKMGVN